MGDINKLPKWAKEKIYSLERNIIYVKDELREALGTYPPSNTRVCKYSYPESNHINLIDYAIVEFDSETGPVRVNVNTNGAVRIDIGTDGYIIPIARNVFEVFGKGR